MAAALYRDNCKLFSTNPVHAFEAALREEAPLCQLSGIGLDDSAMFFLWRRLLDFFRHCFKAFAVCISETLRSNTSIRELDVSNNAFGQSGAQDLASALAENTSLTSVKLRDNAIGDDGVAAVCSALLNNPGSRVECIDCRATGLTSANLSKTMTLLTNNASLTALNLESNGLTADAGEAIGRCLASNRTLKVLCLGSNYLGDVGIKAVCRGLSDPSNFGAPGDAASPLCLLDVSRNGIRTDGAAAIANVIRSRRCLLTELLLAYNPLTPAGCAAVAAALRDRARSPSLDVTLKYLDVTGVEMGRDGEDALADSVTAILERVGSVLDMTGTTGHGDPSPPFVVDGLDDRAGRWRAATSAIGVSPATGAMLNRSMGTSVTDFSTIPKVAPAPPPPAPPSRPRLASALGSMVTGVGLGHDSNVGASPTSFMPTQSLVDTLQSQIEDQARQIAELRDSITMTQQQSRPRRDGAPSPGIVSTASTAVDGKPPGGDAVVPGEWGLHSAAMAGSSMKRLKAVEDGVAALSNEIRWVDEEGLKSRLDAEEELRARIDTLTARLDALEDAGGFPSSTPVRGSPATRLPLGGASSRAGSALGGRSTRSAMSGRTAESNAPPLARETLAKHIRSNEERLVRAASDMEDIKAQLAGVQDTIGDLVARVQGVEGGPSQDAAMVQALADRVKGAVAIMNDRLSDATKGLREAAPVDADELNAMVSKAVSAQLRGVTSRLRSDMDKAVAVAMQTMQRTMDVSAAAKDGDAVAALNRRVDILEQTVTAEQESSLQALEAMMRLSGSITKDREPAAPAAMHPHSHKAGTGILSVSVSGGR